ncbi:hypothetical protein K438DRAFT_1749457 [Mycena galopus ATCC 62051]|nr:hypothetical protein K438DRAFT_1749457 [Mycena galopus ATCC 62051]
MTMARNRTVEHHEYVCELPNEATNRKRRRHCNKKNIVWKINGLNSRRPLKQFSAQTGHIVDQPGQNMRQEFCGDFAKVPSDHDGSNIWIKLLNLDRRLSEYFLAIPGAVPYSSIGGSRVSTFEENEDKSKDDLEEVGTVFLDDATENNEAHVAMESLLYSSQRLGQIHSKPGQSQAKPKPKPEHHRLPLV